MATLWTWALVLNYLLAGAAVLHILLSRREPIAMLAWLMAVTLMPFLGVTAYWVLGSGRLARQVTRRRRRAANLLTGLGDLATAAESDAPAPAFPTDVERVARRMVGFPATDGNDASLEWHPAASFVALEEAIRGARRHVHAIYYIWRDDQTGQRFRDLLAERARAGVEVRLLLDAVGCMALPRSFLAPLRRAGAATAFFLPLLRPPFGRRWSLHLRNHRKLVVVDGELAILGSQNIGHEYTGRKQDVGPWFDAQLRTAGPAARFCQHVFAEDWFLATRERLDRPDFFPASAPAGASRVQILPTGPDSSAEVLGQVLFAALAGASRRVIVLSPYFVPGASLQLALKHAAYRGLHVRVLVPTRSDHPLVLWAARSFYADLIAAGVEVLEYDDAVLHAKVVVVDEAWALVGSANMDVRSFKLNYELSAALYDPRLVRAATSQLEDFARRARRIDADAAARWPVWERLGQGAARLLAPLL